MNGQQYDPPLETYVKVEDLMNKLTEERTVIGNSSYLYFKGLVESLPHFMMNVHITDDDLK